MEREREGGSDIEKEVEELATDLSQATVEVDWKRVGETCAGKPIQKRKMEDVLNKVWKLSWPFTYLKVEKNTLIANFSSREDQQKVLEGCSLGYKGSKYGSISKSCLRLLTGLSWVQYKGSKFTFSNGGKGQFEFKARLDRALANGSWKMLFPSAEVTHGFAGYSDHKPLIL